jgi:hypothetical protein
VRLPNKRSTVCKLCISCTKSTDRRHSGQDQVDAHTKWFIQGSFELVGGCSNRMSFLPCYCRSWLQQPDGEHARQLVLESERFHVSDTCRVLTSGVIRVWKDRAPELWHTQHWLT